MGALLGAAALLASLGGAAEPRREALPDTPPRFAPDPASAASRRQWIFEIEVEHGRPRIERVREVVRDKAIGTARVLGRFAVELWVGRELLDRVRFQVPLAGDGSDARARRHLFARPTFGDVTTRLRVQMADQRRAAYLLLVDRSTGESRRYFWPPAAEGKLEPMVPAGASPAKAAPPAPAGVAPPRLGHPWKRRSNECGPD